MPEECRLHHCTSVSRQEIHSVISRQADAVVTRTNASTPLGDVLLVGVKGGLASKDAVLVACCGLQVNLHMHMSPIRYLPQAWVLHCLCIMCLM